MGSGVNSRGGPKVHTVTEHAASSEGVISVILTNMYLTVSEDQQPPPQVALCHRDSPFFVATGLPCALKDPPLLPYCDDIIIKHQTL